jgi:xylulose-5-phosphate/fructose-6-phosphate phosphoketolase
MRIRVVNLVDLMALFPPDVHPHGLNESDFARIFTNHKDVVFAFHGYQRAIHQLIHGRPNADRFHVRGYQEQGTTTTPFDMVILNQMSRFHLAAEALRRAPRMRPVAAQLIELCDQEIDRAVRYSQEHFQDAPEIRDWVWSNPGA